MPYYGHIYYGYGDFLANNLYVLLLIPVLLLSLWAQFQVSGSFRRYNAVNNRRRITGAQAAEAVLRAHGVFGVPVRPCRGNLTDHYDPRDNTIYLSETVYDAPTIAAVGVAAHEAGHAVAAYFLSTQEPVHQITIVPRGNALGLTISLPDQDTLHTTRNEMRDRIVVLLGGRVAEQLEFDDISTGASNDLQRATKLAHDMIAKYGMNERIGAVAYDDDSEIFVGRDYERTRSYSEQTAAEIDAEVRKTVDQAYAHCTQILTEHHEKLQEIAQWLLEHETMSRSQFEACMQALPIPEKQEGLLAGEEKTDGAEED